MKPLKSITAMCVVIGVLLSCTQNAEPVATVTTPTISDPPSPPQTRVVCIDVVGKDGVVRQDCRTIRVHKKLDGTSVPKK